MASSGSPNHDEEGLQQLIKRAACFRAKYRCGVTATFMPLQCLGIHQKNRSGVFPQYKRCQSLMKNVLGDGFSKETAWHQGVCVEEIPQEQQPTGYVTMHQWNKDCSARHPELEGFLRGPDQVTHGTLSRSHLTLILKVFRNQQRSWPWPDKYKDFVMSNNGLDMIALRDFDADLADVLSQGLKMEVLSWKLSLEEPQGCSQISQALNMGNEIALATSEATALATLSETVTFAIKNSQMTHRAAMTVAFEAVKQSVALELKEFVSRESFVDMFEYVMNMGANMSPFIPKLVDFTSIWVNSETHRLPLIAFKEANKIPNDYPLIKLAIIQRAYMMRPNSQGFVPVPEASWGRVTKPYLHKLDQLLKYWDVELRKSIASMDAKFDQYVTASAATNAAAAFIKYVPIPASRKEGGNVELEMLKVTLEDYEKVIKHLTDGGLPHPGPPPDDAKWIDYAVAQKHVKEEEEKAKQAAEMRPPVAKDEPLLAKCIQYDADGKPLDEQDAIVKTNTETSKVEIPWSPWLRSATGRDMDIERALTSTIYFVLHSLHTSPALVNAPIQILLNETTKKFTALATRDIEVNELQLPPCAPGAGSKLHKEATKPSGIAIQIAESSVQMTDDRKRRLTMKTPEGATPSTTIKTVTHTYFVFPDTKLPSWETLWDDTAVAADRRCLRAMKPLDGKEIMHPFWLVPRMTEKDLRAHNEDAKGTSRAMFNLAFDTIQCGAVATGCMMAKKTNIAWTVDVPIITNNTAIKKGEELILRISPPEKKEKDPKVETWKNGAKRSAAADGGGHTKKPNNTAKDIAGLGERNLTLKI